MSCILRLRKLISKKLCPANNSVPEFNAYPIRMVKLDHYLLTPGRFKTTSKNFSRTKSKAASVTAGLGSETSLFPINAPKLDSLDNPFVAKLCFFRKAAEKPEAQT